MRIEPESVIATGTVVLRPWCAGDVEALTAIYGDPLSAQYVEVPQPYDAAQATKFVRRAIRSRAAGTTFHYAVTLPVADTVVGSAYLHDCAPSEAAAHVSYLIHPNHRGRGLATAALIGLTEAALAAGFLQVLARIEPGNRASETVAAKAGFSVLWSNDEETCWHRTAPNAST
ncbi:GNAT family N-acetyltransferase [Ornithinimicrobium ciconiae]|uniref:GNAT family N-acetyltransferase n=1 Tax=Ornithinimicrobium ciconiae TaxID=2594265 RepID=A0A516G6A2_9MICO|nr:GNAT family N-acetyltransferase [Ornithinimicrobium ciconiae]QDO87054.1 GNAT family N-acetyltransferase [Ornithinimicrobium ciconiae]